jgi:ketosteroid isomerase-like protein
MTSPAADGRAALGRLLAIEDIRHLVAEYALCVDAKDVARLAELFVEDVQATRTETGRDALARFFARSLSAFGTSVHFVMNHLVDIASETSARGVVYCRAEHEVGDRWYVMALQYWDDYSLTEEGWRFARRRTRHWYATDVLSRPIGDDVAQWTDHGAPRLPRDFDSLASFRATTPGPGTPAPGTSGRSRTAPG